MGEVFQILCGLLPSGELLQPCSKLSEMGFQETNLERWRCWGSGCIRAGIRHWLKFGFLVAEKERKSKSESEGARKSKKQGEG